MAFRPLLTLLVVPQQVPIPNRTASTNHTGNGIDSPSPSEATRSLGTSDETLIDLFAFYSAANPSTLIPALTCLLFSKKHGTARLAPLDYLSMEWNEANLPLKLSHLFYDICENLWTHEGITTWSALQAFTNDQASSFAKKFQGAILNPVLYDRICETTQETGAGIFHLVGCFVIGIRLHTSLAICLR